MFSMIYKKHFELDEARTLIPQLKNKLIVIRNIAIKLKAIGYDIYKADYRIGFHPDTNAEFPQDYQRLRQLVTEIYSLGVEIKGIEQGLVDFPAVRQNGEEVFLCWKMDEDDIEFWHSIEDGFQGRHHINEF